MENLPPLNQPSKLIRPPTLKRGRSNDSQGGKVRYNFKKNFILPTYVFIVTII